MEFSGFSGINKVGQKLGLRPWSLLTTVFQAVFGLQNATDQLGSHQVMVSESQTWLLCGLRNSALPNCSEAPFSTLKVLHAKGRLVHIPSEQPTPLCSFLPPPHVAF